jgi:hypothetical protein
VFLLCSFCVPFFGKKEKNGFFFKIDAIFHEKFTMCNDDTNLYRWFVHISGGRCEELLSKAAGYRSVAAISKQGMLTA